MQDKHIQYASGQTLFTTTLPQSRLRNFAINRTAIPSNTGPIMSVATLGKMNRFVEAKSSSKAGDVVVPFLPIQTSTGLEKTLATISHDMTMRAKDLKMASQPMKTVAKLETPQTPKARVVTEYEKIKQDVTNQLLDHQRSRYVPDSPYAFLSKQNEGDLSFLAEMKMQAAMAEVPTVSTIEAPGQIRERYMDETMEEAITDYATAKQKVKQSFLGRMVGPAFAAGALAAAVSMLPMSVGAVDYTNYPDMKILDTMAANPMLIDPPVTPLFTGNYFASFIAYATITGAIAASPMIVRFTKEQGDMFDFVRDEFKKAQFEQMGEKKEADPVVEDVLAL